MKQPAAFLLLLTVATPAIAQVGPTRTDGQRVGDAATQPLADVNLKKREIPPLLVEAEGAPYALGGLKGCAALRAEIGRYDAVLGPDFDSPPAERKRNPGVVAAQLGGNILSGFIPFRGIVREITGASAEDRKFATALYAGVARRAFLKGVATSRGCKR